MVREHEVFLRYLAEGKVIPTAALREMSAVEDEMDRTDDVEVATKTIIKKSGAENYKDYDPQLAKDVAADLVHLKGLRDMVAKAAGAQSDDKLDRLVDALADIAKQAEGETGERASLGDRRKVLIFSYFADTAEWIHRHLAKVIASDDRLAAYRETDKALKVDNKGLRLGWVSGGDESDLTSKKAAGGFAPYSTESGMPDIYDVLVTTDVLAEGVNLQQARHIINYDLPWNPMRMVQRHGRIDRIGSCLLYTSDAADDIL
jgi:ERCC4-related helicase